MAPGYSSHTKGKEGKKEEGGNIKSEEKRRVTFFFSRDLYLFFDKLLI